MGSFGDDDFEMFSNQNSFGDDFETNTTHLRRQAPVTYQLEVSLEDLYRGATRKLKFARKRLDRNNFSITNEKVFEIKIAPGWKAGTKITFEGEGDERVGYLPGDIIFVLSEKPHSRFKRENGNLVYVHKCTIQEVLLGPRFFLLALDGRQILVDCSNDAISSTYVKTVKGEGMPTRTGPKGDLLITFDIQFPKQPLSLQQKEKLKKAFES